ncbi:MAG: GNAT family N-acetyltransferase [Bacillota bacterium]|nr:GNAT family N-acetyltransferase [Bacillota bacterium]
MKNYELCYLKEDEFSQWDEFVDNSPQGNIFNKSFWLKAVSDEFKILVCKENNDIIGGIALPSIYGKIYRNAKLTPQMGVLFKNGDSRVKHSTMLSNNIEVMQSIIEQIKDIKYFDYNFSYNLTNYLPFIWENYKVSVRYTYVIDDLTNLDAVYSNFQYDSKYLIKKSLKNNVTVSSNYGIKEFYDINKKTFERQKIEMPYSYEFLEKLDKVLEEKKSRKMFFAVNQEGVIVAAVYLIYDKDCTYYLMGGADPQYRNIGVQTLLIWESIKFAASVSKTFDFEGSMVKNIERAFREFGGKQRIIYNVYKSDLFTEVVYRIAKNNKNLVRKIFKV